MSKLNDLYANKTTSTVVAKEDLEAKPHTWSKGLDYELIEKKDFFTLTSNEGSVNYVNNVKQNVLVNFEKVIKKLNINEIYITEARGEEVLSILDNLNITPGVELLTRCEKAFVKNDG
ncbi:hypothetical protein ACMGD3_24060 [Lysinibacillus sphaericus]|uniref:hypothetical protein n=1 Tax=Lysinibacillus sphaericus TaxID=1421 RepID=UPI003F79B382